MADKLKIYKGAQSGSNFTYSELLLEVDFNPKDYTVSKNLDFNKAKIPGLNAPFIQFEQGNEQSISIELLLDTYSNEDETKKDVRTVYIEKFMKLVNVDGELHAAPPCRIVWGSLDFKGVVTSMEKRYVFFDKNGIPVRAWVKLSLNEWLSVSDQIKGISANSPDKRKLFKINEGDKIYQIAFKAYGDAAQWRAIADANQMDDPTQLQAGRDIIIPVLDASNRR